MARRLRLPKGTDVAESARFSRVRFSGEHAPGTYRLTFATGPWFGAAGRATFYPEVGVAFGVEDGQPHYHVALLLAPFAYTTYRGS